MTKIAIFASGNGSNFEAIVNAAQSGNLRVNPAVLVCDKPGAGVISRAESMGIETLVVSPATYPDKAAYETAILTELQRRDIRFIVLAGYMRIVGKTLLEAYPGRIINIHPSLLPLFPGLDAIRRAYEIGASETGVTIHYVDEGMDTGPVIAQHRVPIEKDDTLNSLEEKIHKVEHQLYIETLQELFHQ